MNVISLKLQYLQEGADKVLTSLKTKNDLRQLNQITKQLDQSTVLFEFCLAVARRCAKIRGRLLPLVTTTVKRGALKIDESSENEMLKFPAIEGA